MSMHGEVVAFLQSGAAIQPNDCTRLHAVREAMAAGRVYHGPDAVPVERDALMLASGHPFILRHDWLALLGPGFDPWDVQNDFRIPFPITAFEFLADGRPVTLVCLQPEGEPIAMTAIVKCGDSWLFPGVPDETADYPIIQACWDQVRAACVAMDLGLAVASEQPAPERLNAKRQRSGKDPIPTLRVIDIAHKHVRSDGDKQGAGHKRLHFRRGHWRHFDDGHKTWIKWMLVGDPSLGFVEHQYKL